MRAALSTSDPYVTIVQSFCRFGDIEKNQVIVGIDTFIVQFKSNMPKDHKVWFYLTIEDSLGIIYADGFMIKEGEYLPGFIAPKQMKDLVRGYVNQGYTVYLPQGNLIYKDFLGTGFAANDLEKMAGQGGSSWYTFKDWWERFGSSCIHIHWCHWFEPIFRIIGDTYNGEPVTDIWVVDMEVEVLNPEQDAAFPIGDTIGINHFWDAHIWIWTNNYANCYPEQVSWTDTVIWNTAEPPNLGGEWIPAPYQYWPIEFHDPYGYVYEENETRIWWLFTFEILEDLVKKYFNPLKPDSARIVYQILPAQYADPDTTPKPIEFKVEIRDKDSVLVYGPRDLDFLEMKNQVLFWDGINNQGDTVAFEQGPYVCSLTVFYREEQRQGCLFGIGRKTDVHPNGLDLVLDAIEEKNEEKIGGFVWLNKDDDNDNSIKDKDETDNVANENDLVKLTLRFAPEEMVGKITLNATVGAENISIWETSDKQNHISLPVVYNLPSEFPKTFWVEGINTSNTLRDVELVLTYSSSTGDYQDKVKITVFELDATHVAFNHDETSTNEDAINIRKDYDNDVDIPEWIIDDGLHPDPDEDLDPDRNDPAAYIKDKSNIVVKVRFTVKPEDITSAEIMAEAPEDTRTLGNFEWKDIDFEGGISEGQLINNISGFVEFTSEKGTADSVKIEEITWQWKAKDMQKNGQSDLPLNSVEACTVYTIFDDPKPPWMTFDIWKPWSKVLKYSCGWAVDKNDINEIIGILVERIYYSGMKYDGGQHYTNPSYYQFYLANFLEDFENLENPNQPQMYVDCRDGANFFHVLAASLGKDAYYRVLDRTTPPGYFFYNWILPMKWSDWVTNNIWNYHQVGWCNNINDGVLMLDEDDPTSPPHLAKLPVQMSQSDYLDLLTETPDVTDIQTGVCDPTWREE